jgi:hypothetical protein
MPGSPTLASRKYWCQSRGLKKNAMAAFGEASLADKGWLPPVLAPVVAVST